MLLPHQEEELLGGGDGEGEYTTNKSKSVNSNSNSSKNTNSGNDDEEEDDQEMMERFDLKGRAYRAKGTYDRALEELLHADARKKKKEQRATGTTTQNPIEHQIVEPRRKIFNADL